MIDFQNNPTLTLARGNTYVFNLTLSGVFPFWIKTEPVTGLGETYSSGVTRNGATTGLVTFTVPQDAPDTLYYASQNQVLMQGTLNIVNSTAGTGPGFWIQSTPGAGVSGTTNKIAKFNSPTSVSDSLIRDDGSNVYIGVTPSFAVGLLNVNGDAYTLYRQKIVLYSDLGFSTSPYSIHFNSSQTPITKLKYRNNF